MTINTLFLKKLLVAFLVGAGSYAGPRILDILNAINATGNYDWSRSVLLTLLYATIAAGIRAAFVLLPFNLVPSDKQPVLQPPPAPKVVAAAKPAAKKRAR